MDLEILKYIKKVCVNSKDCHGCPLKIPGVPCTFRCIPKFWEIKEFEKKIKKMLAK